MKQCCVGSGVIINDKFIFMFAPIPLKLESIATDVLAAAYRLHVELGPGLLESVYEAILARDLARSGYVVERQKPMAIEYDGLRFEEGFRADLVIDDCFLVELKSVEQLGPIHGKQLLTYLKLRKFRLGLLLNFGAALLKDGLKRVVN